MTTDVLALADRLWRGEVHTSEYHPVGHLGGLAEITDDVVFLPAFANVTAIRTPDGLVLVDTGSAFAARAIHDELRRWTDAAAAHRRVLARSHRPRLRRRDMGGGGGRHGWPAPVVIAHEALPRRFDRYRMTAGYNEIINQRQFGIRGLRWPTEYRYPDRTYAAELTVEVGGTTFDAAAREGRDRRPHGHLDARARRCCAAATCSSGRRRTPAIRRRCSDTRWSGRRRCGGWSRCEPEYLLPGHGLPVIGADRVATALTDTAELLESLVSQTLAIMNDGGRLDDAIHSVVVPGHLADRPYLQPVYDEPEFIVRTVWRLYGGWWDGNPATLKPARERALAAEIARLAGGAAALAARAVELAESVDTELPYRPAREPGDAVPGDQRVASLRGGEEGLRTGGAPGRARLAGRARRRRDQAGQASGLQYPGRPGDIHDGHRGIPVGGQRVARRPAPQQRLQQSGGHMTTMEGIDPSVPPSGTGCVECDAAAAGGFTCADVQSAGTSAAAIPRRRSTPRAHAQDDRAPDHHELRARRGLVLRLPDQRDVRGRPGPGAARSPSAGPAGAGPARPGAARLAVTPALGGRHRRCVMVKPQERSSHTPIKRSKPDS